MPHKFVVDEAKGIITLDGLDVEAIELDIKISEFGHPSKVTMAFMADVTLVPPNRNEQEEPICLK